jgi:hypothetical protein
MATVRISVKLKDDIRLNARKLFEKRLSEVTKFPIPDIGERVFILWLESDMDMARDYEAAKKRGWLGGQCTAIQIRSINNVKIGSHHPMSVGRPLPRSFHAYDYGLDLNSEYAQPMADAITKWRAEQKEVDAENTAFQQKVKVFLERHTTLKQALTEWPAMWDLVPQWAKDEHNRQTEKPADKRAREEKEQFDVSDLTAAVVTAKLVDSLS